MSPHVQVAPLHNRLARTAHLPKVQQAQQALNGLLDQLPLLVGSGAVRGARLCSGLRARSLQLGSMLRAQPLLARSRLRPYLCQLSAQAGLSCERAKYGGQTKADVIRA